ncbi:hypothetical protein Z947_1262 [Sulfitobacter geojensis]|nr:hypothetical protein Z947_1262 [Sulfitobacter geojensis]
MDQPKAAIPLICSLDPRPAPAYTAHNWNRFLAAPVLCVLRNGNKER